MSAAVDYDWDDCVGAALNCPGCACELGYPDSSEAACEDCGHCPDCCQCAISLDGECPRCGALLYDGAACPCEVEG